MKKVPEKKQQIRCAIYTRKSTEEGLDQEFNSLDAQRESAEAFIASQRHEGWVCLPERYDDGGFTGGNMERPALRRLMAAAEAGGIDAVVVYKVDRLSRSLLDFTRIMEVLDRRGVSFVSVTQQFNTTNSMGRLTLNILLSFAQFEREIIAERTRDKMGAARRKGKWTGGKPFLGYDIVPGGRALMVNEAEAQRVRQIFGIYLKTQSIQATVAELNRRDWTMKRWTTQKGRDFGGGAFNKSSLHGLLTNVAYIGQVNYQGHIADAEFPGIVDPATFRKVQKYLAENNRCTGARVRNRHGSLLRGILRCGHCQTTMVHAYTRKGETKVYRYYVCNRAMKEGWDKCPAPSLPAGEIERFVVEEVARIGRDPGLQEEVIRQHAAARRRELAEIVAERRKLEQQIKRLRDEVREAAAKGDAERLVECQRQADAVERALADNRARGEVLAAEDVSEEVLRSALERFTPVWESLTLPERERMLQLLVERVTYDGASGEIAIAFRPAGIRALEMEAAK
jgi:site-specific DNA recombinase